MGLKESGLRGSLRSVSTGVGIPDSEDLHAHYDAASFDLNDGETITAWPDETGQQGDVTGQATYVSDSAEYNGPAVSFDGTDDGLTTLDNEVGSGTQWESLPDPFHIFLVSVSFDSSSSDSRFVEFPGSSSYIFRQPDGDGAFEVNSNNNITASFFDNNAHIHTYVGGSDAKYRIDGSEEGTSSTNRSLDGLSMGGSEGGADGNRTEGEIAELLIYDRELDTDTESQVEDYLSDKWGIPI